MKFSSSFCRSLFVASSLVVLAGCAKYCSRAGSPETDAGREPPKGRLVILGFDGVDPRWLERYKSEGKLPNLARLMTADHYRRLGSTNPPQSPVAWTSFATGTRPGSHGIFDFIARKLNHEASGPPVLPAIATTSFEVEAVGPPVARNLRTGEPFWQTLANDGVRIEAINVPYSFPPDPMREGRMLSGLGTPDIRGTNSTFTYVGTDLTEEQVLHPPGGGIMVKLVMDGSVGRFELDGPGRPGHPGQRMKLPAEVRVEGDALALKFGNVSARAPRGEFSDWITVTFEDGPTRVKGYFKALAVEVSPQTRLFLTPISVDPREPYTDVSYPREYAKAVLEALGHPYKTVGWDHDTSALNAEVVDDSTFLRDMNAIETDRRAMLVGALERDDWKMLVWVSTATDRVAHMFYRLIDPEHPRFDAAAAAAHGDAIEREYRRMDETVGIVLSKLRPDDRLVILSDHGFHNYRRGLHVNRWLVEHGYLALRDGAATGDIFGNVDWSQTKAYALGTGQIYFNRRGRERDGTVSADDIGALSTRLRDELKAVRDVERNSAVVVDEVYAGQEVFSGARAEDAPDLQIAFAENYRTSWETILGGVPEGLFADNSMKWSGDHSASDVRDTPGILISNAPLRDGVEIVDLAPTALEYFGRRKPAHYVGRSVFR